jgi:protein involved in polysaccharide export with SLBB domain
MLKKKRHGGAAWPKLILSITLLMFVSACTSTMGEIASGQADTTKSIAGATTTSAEGVSMSTGAKIGNGDKLRITTFNEPQLSGEFVVDETGAIPFPLIGQIKVVNLNTQEIEQLLKSKLSGRYLVNPRIGVEVMNQRPFYILGEVAKAGEYPYRPGMNVVGAIATAGGFSPRASSSYVIIRRANGGEQQRYPIEPSVAVFPGDMITVPERMF